MNRTINYLINETEDGLRVEQYLKRKGYSSQNLATIKRMPESILATVIIPHLFRLGRESG